MVIAIIKFYKLKAINISMSSVTFKHSRNYGIIFSRPSNRAAAY